MPGEHMESRRAVRVKVFIKANIAPDGSIKKHFDISKKTIEAYILDISILGAGILSKYFFPKGAVLDLKFTISLKDERQEEKEHSFFLRGQVRSAIPWGRGSTRLGIEFIGIDEQQRGIISKFVEQNLKKNS